MLDVEEAKNKILKLGGEERFLAGGGLVYDGGRYGKGGEGELFEPTSAFEIKLCELIKVPNKFYNRCSEKLKANVLMEFAGGEDRFGLVIRNNKVDSIGRAGDVFLPAKSILDEVVKVFGENATFDNIKLEGGVYEIEAVSSDIKITPREGDVSHGGVVIRFGQFGGINFRISVGSYIYRLVCRNGLMRKESENNFVVSKIGGNQEVMKFFNTLMLETKNKVKTLYIREYAESAEKGIEDPLGFLRVVAKEASVPAELVEGMMDLVPDLPENPAYYDVANLITSYANSHEWARRKLLYAGGRAVDNSVKRCKICRRSL